MQMSYLKDVGTERWEKATPRQYDDGPTWTPLKCTTKLSFSLFHHNHSYRLMRQGTGSPSNRTQWRERAGRHYQNGTIRRYRQRGRWETGRLGAAAGVGRFSRGTARTWTTQVTGSPPNKAECSKRRWKTSSRRQHQTTPAEGAVGSWRAGRKSVISSAAGVGRFSHELGIRARTWTTQYFAPGSRPADLVQSEPQPTTADTQVGLWDLESRTPLPSTGKSYHCPPHHPAASDW